MAKLLPTEGFLVIPTVEENVTSVEDGAISQKTASHQLNRLALAAAGFPAGLEAARHATTVAAAVIWPGTAIRADP